MGVLEIGDRSLLLQDGRREVALEIHSARVQEQTECMPSTVEVGLACSDENPRDRMKMEEAKLKPIQTRDKIL